MARIISGIAGYPAGYLHHEQLMNSFFQRTAPAAGAGAAGQEAEGETKTETELKFVLYHQCYGSMSFYRDIRLIM